MGKNRLTLAAALLGVAATGMIGCNKRPATMPRASARPTSRSTRICRYRRVGREADGAIANQASDGGRCATRSEERPVLGPGGQPGRRARTMSSPRMPEDATSTSNLPRRYPERGHHRRQYRHGHDLHEPGHSRQQQQLRPRDRLDHLRRQPGRPGWNGPSDGHRRSRCRPDGHADLRVDARQLRNRHGRDRDGWLGTSIGTTPRSTRRPWRTSTAKSTWSSPMQSAAATRPRSGSKSASAAPETATPRCRLWSMAPKIISSVTSTPSRDTTLDPTVTPPFPVLTVVATDPESDPISYMWNSVTPGCTVQFGSPAMQASAAHLRGYRRHRRHDLLRLHRYGAGYVGPVATPQHNTVVSSLTLPVVSATVLQPPVFGLAYQSDSTVTGGEQEVLAAVATDPTGGTLTYSFSWAVDTTTGTSFATATPASLSLDPVFTTAGTWTAPANAQNASSATFTVTATSSVSHLSASYVFIFAPANNPCIGVANGTTCSIPSNLCVINATCQNSACIRIQKVCPTSTTACQDNVCAPATGLCGLVNEADGTACNDHNGCTSGDACAAGACVTTRWPARLLWRARLPMCTGLDRRCDLHLQRDQLRTGHDLRCRSESLHRGRRVQRVSGYLRCWHGIPAPRARPRSARPRARRPSPARLRLAWTRTTPRSGFRPSCRWPTAQMAPCGLWATSQPVRLRFG